MDFFLMLICFGFLFCSSPKHQETELDLRDRVKTVVLDNGMTFLLVRRDTAPTFSVELRVKVGSIEDAPGATGLAHFFEHMAFKGTDKIGTKDFAKEKPILDQVLTVGTQIAEMKRAGKSPAEYAELTQQRLALETEQNQFIEKNDFVRIFQRNGGGDVNAWTSNDFTSYHVSLPSSKFELWAYLQSEQFTNRVFREFFTEKDVIAEERRMRVDNVPEVRLYEHYVKTAFDTSPYRVHPIGYPQDIQNYEPKQAMDFYEKYYIPSRMVVAIVGDIDIAKSEKIIHTYFSKLVKKPDVVKVVPPEKLDASFPRHVTLQDEGQARFYLGYYRPAFPHADDTVLDVVQGILCDGRTSRLYKRLVLKDHLVAQVSCYASTPGVRADSLFTFSAEPLSGHTNQEVQDVIRDEIKMLAQNGPTADELNTYKNKSDADLIYSLESNKGLASSLSFYQTLAGDWEYLYQAFDQLHKTTADDVQRVVKTYFIPGREVSANLEHNKPKS